MKISHSFRESKNFPLIMKKSNIVSILSIGFQITESQAPDLIVIAEENEVPIAAIHFNYHYTKETWEVGNVFHDNPISDKVVHVILDEAEVVMKRASEIVGAKGKVVVKIGKQNFDSQVEYSKRGYIIEETGLFEDSLIMKKEFINGTSE